MSKKAKETGKIVAFLPDILAEEIREFCKSAGYNFNVFSNWLMREHLRQNPEYRHDLKERVDYFGKWRETVCSPGNYSVKMDEDISDAFRKEEKKHRDEGKPFKHKDFASRMLSYSWVAYKRMVYSPGKKPTDATPIEMILKETETCTYVAHIVKIDIENNIIEFDNVRKKPEGSELICLLT